VLRDFCAAWFTLIAVSAYHANPQILRIALILAACAAATQVTLWLIKTIRCSKGWIRARARKQARRLRMMGLPFEAIADRLNDEGVESPWSQSWTSRTVGKLLSERKPGFARPGVASASKKPLKHYVNRR